ncbi:MAG: ABC transporter permease [Deltaproteobacteria bacterium]|nr:ABC transporter permease [Deltaproteobacteria bacterium]
MINLAWKNLWRNKARTFTTLLSLVGGLVVAIPAFALARGVSKALKKSIISTRLGEYQLVDKTSTNQYNRKVFSLNEVIDTLDIKNEITWAPRLDFPGKIIHDRKFRLITNELVEKCSGNFTFSRNGICTGYLDEKTAKDLDISDGSRVFIKSGHFAEYCEMIQIKFWNKNSNILHIKTCKSHRIKNHISTFFVQKSKNVMFSGTDLLREPMVTELNKKIISGRWKISDTGLIIGEELSRKLGVKTGDSCLGIIKGKHSIPTDEIYKVQGIFRTNIPRLDSSLVIIPIQTLRRISGDKKSDEVNIIVFNSREGKPIQAINALDKLKNFKLTPWWITAASLFQIANFNEALSIMIIVIIMVMASIGVMNSIMMSIMDRRREFAMLSAIGMSRQKLFSLIVMESMIINILTVTAGCFLSYFIVSYMSKYGINLSFIMKDGLAIGGMVIDPHWKAELTGRVFIIPVAIFTLINLSISMWPAWRAGRYSPAVEMRD